MAYIHELPDWPNLSFDPSELALILAEVRLRQGRLLGRISSVGRAPAGLLLIDEPQLQLHALTHEVIQTSAIEGERLSAEQVRSSVARRLGLPVGHALPAGRSVEGLVEMLFDATLNYAAPLDVARLFAWHAALFPTGRSGLGPIRVGAWREGPIQVVSGPMGRQRVHFEGPAADRISAEIERFLQWMEGTPTLDPLLRAGLAQLWFLTIHPFDDGNGRIARAITELLLARSEGSGERFYSLSRQIRAERADYYRELERAQRGGLDVTGWLAWFLGCLGRAFGEGEAALDAALTRARFWAAHRLVPITDRQRRVVEALLAGFEGKLTSSKVASMNHVSGDTALRDLEALVERGLLTRLGAGRGTHYRLAPATFPSLWRTLPAAAALGELRATGRLAHATLTEPLPLRELATNRGIGHPIHLEDCRIPCLDGSFTTYEAPVTLEGCTIGDVQLVSTFFPAGLVIRGCTFTGPFTVECGGHNQDGAAVEFSDTTFLDFANFFDCLYEGPFRMRGCTFEVGTNLLGNVDQPFAVTFVVPPEITGCVGRMDMSGG